MLGTSGRTGRPCQATHGAGALGQSTCKGFIVRSNETREGKGGTPQVFVQLKFSSDSELKSGPHLIVSIRGVGCGPASPFAWIMSFIC